ncbi:hypothetical protein ACLMJK_002428 [Lecanora helva]
MADMQTENENLPKSLRILCFGDSLTAGYTKDGYEHYPYADHLRTSLEHMLSSPDIEVEVAGLSGDQVQGNYLRRIKAKCPIARERRYDWVIIMGGTNDLGWGQPPERIYEGLKPVWKAALDTGANVLALNVLEVAASSSRAIDMRNSLNTMIKNHRENRFAIPYKTLDRTKREEIWDDGLHLTGKGYKLMGDVIAVRLFEILKDEHQATAAIS